MTLQQYLTHEADNGMKTEFRIVASKERSDKVVTLYIHPLGKDGLSLDFEINGNTVRCITPAKETRPPCCWCKQERPSVGVLTRGGWECPLCEFHRNEFQSNEVQADQTWSLWPTNEAAS